MNMRKKHFLILFILSTLILAFSSLSAQNSKSKSAAVFQQASIRMDKNQQAPLEVRFQKEQNVTVTGFFEAYSNAYNLSKNNEAIVFSESNDDLGQTHHRVKQYYKGLELAEVQYLLHEKEGSVIYANGKLIHDLNIDVTPVLSENEALQKALDHINADSYMWENKKNEAHIKKIRQDREATYYPVGELKISAGLKKHIAENFRLVYRFDIFAQKPRSRNYVDVDAKTGEIVGTLSRLKHDDVQGYGTTLYNGDVDIVVADENNYLPDRPEHFHINDWNAYGGSGTSWWVADTNLGTNGGYDDLWYEVIDTDEFTLVGSESKLSFYHRYAVEAAEGDFPDGYNGWDGMNVRISTDGGTSWQVLENPTPAYSKTSLYGFGHMHGEGTGIPGWAGRQDDWTEVTFDLSAFTNNTVRIRFAFASDPLYSTGSGDPELFGWQIDSIIVSNSAGTLYSNDGVNSGISASNIASEVRIIEGNYRLRENGRGEGIVTYNMQNQDINSLSVDFVDVDSNFTDQDDLAGVSTHWAAEASYDYFLTKHGRNSFNDVGGRIISYAHAGIFINASWNGEWMEFGSGDGSNDYQSTVSLDVVSHELAHGVTEYTANLIYADEPGALNESFSDIFGELVEAFKLDGDNDWIKGDDVGLGYSISNPKSTGNPDTYLGNLWQTGTFDNGGIHSNSFVQNYWFYLLSEGGTGVNDYGDPYTVEGIGMDEAAQIAYRNLAVYLMPSSQYVDAMLGSLNAAIDLFGENSAEYNSVKAAWNAVGVYPPFYGPYPQYTTINGNFFVDGIDTLIVTSRINNPDNHNIEVKSIFSSFDQTISDTVLMFDDGAHHDSSSGDGIYGVSWSVPLGESKYTVQTKTVSLDSGFQNILRNAATFTTIGPLKYYAKFDEFFRIRTLSKRFLFKINLQNMGVEAIADKIVARLKFLSEDSCYTMYNDYGEFNDLAPGEIVSSVQDYDILIDKSCWTDDSIRVNVTFGLDIESDGDIFWSDTFSIDTTFYFPSDITDEEFIQPHVFALHQNFPNPFNPTTVINYQLPLTNHVELTIHNMLGQKVFTLVSGEQKAGEHQVEWDASGIASGVYYYQIKTGDFQAVRKMILLR